MEIISGGNVTFTKQPDIIGDFIVMNSTDGTANAGDNIIIEDGGTDGSGTNDGSSLL